MGPGALLNYSEYELWAIIVTMAGGLFWIVMYALIVRKIILEKYVEMPIVAACGNFAWEFLWGFVFADMVTLGTLFVWSYRIWFFLDIFIFYNVLKHGGKQIAIPELRKHWPVLGILVSVAFGALIYTFVVTGKDHLWGAPSAYMLNVCISGLFITLFLRQRAVRVFSKTMAWCKMIGSLSYSIAYLSFQPDEPFLRVICAVIFVLDVTYLVLLYTNKVFPEASEPATA